MLEFLYKNILKAVKYYKLHSEFSKDLSQFKKLNDNRFSVPNARSRPILFEKTSTTSFDSHYIYHPAWAARIIKRINPEKHIDISSTLHFCTHLSAFIQTEFYDFRPARLELDNLKTGRADLTQLPFPSNSILSLSCMHTIEHVGLGRYGDPIDPLGDKRQ